MEHSIVTPNLMVEDVAATARFYIDILGFDLVVAIADMHKGMAEGNVIMQLSDGLTLDWANVKGEGAAFMFQSRSSLETELPVMKGMSIGASQTLYIRRDNIDEQYEMLRKKVEVIQEPIDKFYGMREWYLRDNNGYVLCFGQPAIQPG